MADDLDQLRARLAAAEDLCVMFAWTVGGRGSDRDKAAHELWKRWVDVSGNDCSREQNPHLTEELITELATKRDATRRATLARMGVADDTPKRCPVHHIPDCSPLLNGCSRVINGGV